LKIYSVFLDFNKTVPIINMLQLNALDVSFKTFWEK